jgi:hypothetical protein
LSFSSLLPAMRNHSLLCGAAAESRHPSHRRTLPFGDLDLSRRSPYPKILVDSWLPPCTPRTRAMTRSRVKSSSGLCGIRLRQSSC